jgi:mono/diheme cytochrome c family protein
VIAILIIALLHAAGHAEQPAPPTAEQLEFFESKVRPLFSERCSECHGAEEQWAGLRLDSRQALIDGGESGPAIVSGKVDESRLIMAVRQTGDLQMPPDGKLDDVQIAALESWVAMGAPWPASELPPVDAKADAARTHWAFQPIATPEPPSVEHADWVRTPVDAFVLAKLEAAGLAPAPAADRRTLIRRVTFDLTGLPPTPAEVEAFVADPDPNAYAMLVERLLASPRYGEHWARLWLDVARYSDTKGYVYGREERFFVHAPAFRDWVVNAFNTDLPYDKFLLLQLAADQAAPEDRAALAAMGYVTLGRRFLGVAHDIIDDRIDVVARGMLGLTVGCARCHDHKFDPIPIEDYYSLYGVFHNTTERLAPIGESSAAEAERVAAQQELEKRQAALDDGMKASRAAADARARSRVAEYLLAQRELAKYPDEVFSQILAPSDLIPAFVHRWNQYLREAAQKNDAIFLPWRRFVALSDEKFAAQASAISRELAAMGDDALNPLVRQAFSEPPASIEEVAQRYAALFGEVVRQWQEQSALPQPPAALADAAAESLRQVMYGAHSPSVVPDEAIVTTEFFFDTATTVPMWQLQGEVDRWLIQTPAVAPHAVALVDREWIIEPRVFKRGSAANRGDEVPRRFLRVLAGPNRQPFTRGSGRLELAQAIIAPDNPLTARVWANRIWARRFGIGLVATPSDFGLRVEAPSHPELLDWLASQLIWSGWSTKHLHRQMVLSSAYQQLTAAADAAVAERASAVDPQNRLLWRMNSRRLTFEEWRDSLLAASGELRQELGGRSQELFVETQPNFRRTLYGLVDRQFLTSAMRTFDFANPDLHTPARSETTVSQQALFGLNHPFIADRSRALGKQLEGISESDAAARIRALYQLVYQREPTDAEMRLAFDFVTVRHDEQLAIRPETLSWEYGYGTLNEADGQVTFEPLPYFNGAAWQGGPSWPDASLGWVQLTADGGHAGNDPQHAAIRRWKAPRSGRVNIKSEVQHDVATGDGIRCWIVSSRHGVLKGLPIHNEKRTLDVSDLAVEEGDVIDFIVDFNADLNSDMFLWPAEVLAAAAEPAAAETRAWISPRDFAGKPSDLLDGWEQLAQVLLLSNEMMFIE